MCSGRDSSYFAPNFNLLLNLSAHIRYVQPFCLRKPTRNHLNSFFSWYAQSHEFSYCVPVDKRQLNSIRLSISHSKWASPPNEQKTAPCPSTKTSGSIVPTK